MKKLLIIGGIAALLPSLAFAAYVGAGDSVSAPVSASTQNVYLVGGTVNVSNPVPGDVVTAGGTIVASGNIEKDALIIGGNISIIGGSVEDLRVVGGNITIGKNITGEAMIAGGQINLTPDTQIKGDSYLAGGTIVFSGKESGNLTLAGGNIRVDGTVNGNLKIKGAEKVTFGSQAVVKGMIEYSSPNEAVIETGAQLTNTPVFKKVENVSGPSKKNSNGFMAFFGVMFFLKLIAFLTASYLLWHFWKRDMVSAIEEVHGRFWKVLFHGFATMILVPIASIILLFTVVGWIPAIVMMGLYLVLMALMVPVAMIITASVVLRLFKESHTSLVWYHILLGFVVLSLVMLIPVIGWLVSFIIYLVSLGATVGIMKARLTA